MLLVIIGKEMVRSIPTPTYWRMPIILYIHVHVLLYMYMYNNYYTHVYST